MDGYGKRILVIDDDSGCRDFLTVLLEGEGYIVHQACTGSAGLDEMSKRRFDAVIADCRIPDLTGVEFTAFSRVTWPDTPVILLSGDLDDLTGYADEYGAAACIRKPYEATMFLSVLRTVTQPVSTEQAAFPLVHVKP